MTIYLSRRELAEVYGVTVRQVFNWEEAGLPSEAQGNRKRYPLREAVLWHEAREVARALAALDTGALDAARLRKLEAEAESKELDVQVKRGSLIPLDEVDDVIRACNLAVDSVLRSAPARFAPTLAKRAGIGVKDARSILADIVELSRSAIREDAVGALALEETPSVRA